MNTEKMRPAAVSGHSSPSPSWVPEDLPGARALLCH